MNSNVKRIYKYKYEYQSNRNKMINFKLNKIFNKTLMYYECKERHRIVRWRQTGDHYQKIT